MLCWVEQFPSLKKKKYISLSESNLLASMPRTQGQFRTILERYHIRMHVAPKRHTFFFLIALKTELKSQSSFLSCEHSTSPRVNLGDG